MRIDAMSPETKDVHHLWVTICTRSRRLLRKMQRSELLGRRSAAECQRRNGLRNLHSDWWGNRKQFLHSQLSLYAQSVSCFNPHSQESVLQGRQLRGLRGAEAALREPVNTPSSAAMGASDDVFGPNEPNLLSRRLHWRVGFQKDRLARASGSPLIFMPPAETPLLPVRFHAWSYALFETIPWERCVC